MFKPTMRAHLGILYCVECFVGYTTNKGPDTGLRDRQQQRMAMEAKERVTVPVKYGTAEHVQVTDDGKTVISEKQITPEDAEKVASSGGKTKKKINKTVVTDKDYKRTDEDHIPGD